MGKFLLLSRNLRGLGKKFVEFVDKNKTTKAITFKFEHDKDPFTTDKITIFLEKSIKKIAVAMTPPGARHDVVWRYDGAQLISDLS